MRFGLAIGFALLLAADIPASAQIYPGGNPGGYPGRYPGGGYPGGGYPGGGYPGGYPGAGGGVGFPGGRRGRNQQQTESLTGMMRNLSSNNLELGRDDKRVISVSVNNKTKYYLTSGNTGHQADFSPGDHVSIDALKDQNNYYYAVRVTLMEKGSPEDRAAASKPIEAGSSSSEASSQESSSGGSVAGDDDRPRLHRSPSNGSSDASSGRSAGDQPVNSGSTSTATASTQRPAPPDPDDSGPPVLRRGKPTGESSASSSGTPSAASTSAGAQSSNVASARPTVTADEVNGVVRPPAPPQIARNSDGTIARTSLPQETSGDPVIQRAREAAFQFTETLPNYVVKQYTTRYQTDAASKDHTSWQALDTISADVVSEKGVETYKNLQVNGKPTKESPEKTGSWSTGEFSSMLQDILHPATNADFFNKRSSTVANRAAWHYDYSVEQPNSHWTVQASAETYKPAYKGSIWIDKETFRVLRIEMQARNVPKSFPLDTVESVVDYDYVLIGQGKFLLPVHSESLSCVRGSSDCSRNTIDFRNYRKFEADTSITFEPEKTGK